MQLYARWLLAKVHADTVWRGVGSCRGSNREVSNDDDDQATWTSVKCSAAKEWIGGSGRSGKGKGGKRKEKAGR